MEMDVKKNNRRFIALFKDKNKRKYIYTILGLFAVLGALFAVYYYVLQPNIVLNGNTNIKLDYMEKYNELGYKATYMGKDVTNEVKVTGVVNENKLGTYDIVYEADGIFKRKITRHVTVTDKSGPVISLEENSDIYLCPGSKYDGDTKYSALDNYDGDVTSSVVKEILDDKVVYRAVDKHGNKGEASRKLIYKDIDPPVITLKGNSTVYVTLGESYTETGYEVSDNCDSSLTDKVSVTGSVDTNKAGTYELTYSVVDSSGNNASVTRSVMVAERGKNGTIYLTFDDGPRNGTTNVILDILKEEGVKATFFVTNGGPDELIKREYDEGHTVALHTASHDYATVYASVDAYFNDLNIVSTRVKNITGEESKIIRFPGGSSNTVSRHYCVGIMSTLTQLVLERGYRYYDWNVSSGDAAGGTVTKEMVYSNVVNSLSRDRINVVLMHDIKPYTRDALRDIIRYGKKNGYTFERITPATQMVTQRVNN